MASLAAQIIDQRINGIVERHADAFAAELGLGAGDDPRRRSAAFTFLAARTVLDLTDDEALDCIVDGGDDFGVDALSFGEPEGGAIPVVLIQSKYRRRLDGAAAFPENGIARMIDAVGTLFDPGRQVTVNERLRHRIEEIRSFVADGAIPSVIAIAANNGARWTPQAQQRIDRAAEDFGNQVEWRHVGAGELLDLLQQQAPVNDTLQLAGLATVEAFQFRRVLIGRCSVGELARLAERYGNRLFEKNIRHYLGLAGNRVNEALAATLREPAERPNFYFYNNGVTLTCSQFRHNALQHGDWQVRMEGLQIVNGGQTARTVQKLAEEIGPEIGGAEVLVRIYELPPDDDGALIDAVTFATNSQNPVDLRDLKANDSRQRALAASIRALGYGYRPKRSERAVSPREFTSATVAEAVLAVWRQRPHQARFRSREHFGILYDTIFTSELNGAQAVVAALALRLAENRRKRPPRENAPDFLPYGSRFTAMWVGWSLLGDMGLQTPDELDHRNFGRALELLEQAPKRRLRRAEREIAAALKPLFHRRERTLQRLSAAFRRADLVEMLMSRTPGGP